MPPESIDANGSVVFIVDDDEGVRSSLQLLVRSLGLSSEAFSSERVFSRRTTAATRAACCSMSACRG